MSGEFEPKLPGITPEEGGQDLKGSEEKVQENRFLERLSVLKINPQEMEEGDMEKLKSINEKIEQADAPWVVRVMDEIKRGSGEDYLLKSFSPEDVEGLQKIAQEKGYDFAKEGIVSGQAKELASEFRKRTEAGAKEPAKEKEAAAPPEEISPEARKAQDAEGNREKTHEEIAQHLVERPGEALGIFMKGVDLKIEKAVISFENFWKQSGAKVLKGLSFAGEKALGRPVGELTRAAWITGEFFEAWPGIRRLDNVLKIHASIERLQSGGGNLTPEQINELRRLREFQRYAGKDQWEEIEGFNAWHEKKRKTMEAIRTFNQARKKLTGWMVGKDVESWMEREQATKKKISEISKKFKV